MSYFDEVTVSGNVRVSGVSLFETKSVNASGNPIGIDTNTRAQIGIDYAHHEIHDGGHYHVQGYLELSSGQQWRASFKTPSGAEQLHFLYDIKSTGICTSYFDEAASGGMSGGVSVTPLNNNRNFADASVVMFSGNVGPASGYTMRLENDKWGADGFKENIGGGAGRDDELVLKEDTTYMRTFISGADDNIIQFKASWYEHTPKTD